MAETTTIHASVRARFPAYRFGLLDADSAQEVRAHVRACGDCHAAFTQFTELAGEGEDDRFGHVPQALLSRWDQALAALPAPERALLEAHRSGCANCAEGIEFSRRMRVAPARTRWRSRLGLAAGAGAALVATLLVVMRDTPLGQGPKPVLAPSLAGAAHARTPVSPESPAASPSTVTRPLRRAAVVQLGNASRGGAGQVVRVPAGTTALPLRVPPLLGVGPDSRIRIDVTGPDGGTYGHAEVRHRRLFGETPAPALEAIAPDGGALPAGRYDVSAVSDVPDPTAPGSFERADYGFDLQLPPESTSP